MITVRNITHFKRCHPLISVSTSLSISTHFSSFLSFSQEFRRAKNHEKFNSVTQKVKPENQNQEHNVRSEAVEPKNWQV